jgi:hypothetical protein
VTADNQRGKSGWKSILREGMTKRIVVEGKKGRRREKKKSLFEDVR